MNNPLDRRFVIGGMLPVDNLYGTAFTGEEDAHTFRITAYDGSVPAAITGQIAGKFVNPAGVTVPLSGSLDEDGRALVTLDEHCYAVEGRFILTIWAGREVIYCGVGQVMNSQTDTIDYPTAGIPDVAALIQQLQTILNNWPADYSQLQNDVSSLKSASGKIINDVYDVSSDKYNCTIGGLNTGTGGNINNDTTSAKTGYIATSNIFFSLADNTYQYRVLFCETNTSGTGNGLYVTNWQTTAPQLLSYPSAGYFKVQFRKDGVTDLTSDDLTSIVSKQKLFTYNKIVIDDTLTETGEAADAKATGDKLDELHAAQDATGDAVDALENLTENRRNLFWMSDYTDSNITVTYQQDGAIIINGTHSGTTSVPIMGAQLPQSTTVLQSGIYTAKIKSIPSAVSLRYGGDTRWVNTANQEVTISTDNAVPVWLKISGSVTFTNEKLYVQIVEGYAAGDFTKSGKTDIDYIARENVVSARESIGIISDYNDEIIQETLIKTAFNTVANLNKQHGRMLNFGAITDTHVYPGLDPTKYSFTNNINLFVKAMEVCDFGVHCGDITESKNLVVEGTYPTHDEFIANSILAFKRFAMINKPLYYCRGNHDVNNYDGSDAQSVNAISNAEFNVFTRSSYRDIVYNESDPYGNYYYIDYPLFKIRVIVLNFYTHDDAPTQDFGETQVNWLTGTAFDFTGKTDWAVLIFDHAGKNSASGDGKGITGALRNFRQSSSVPIIAWIHGNDHADNYANTLTNDTSGVTLNIIGIDQSFVKNPNGNAGEVIGSASEYCVDVFSVDMTNHVLYETRIGRGNSRSYKFGVSNSDNYLIT